MERSLSLPETPSAAVLRAIQQVKDYRTWTPREMYDAIREAIDEVDEPSQEVRMPGDGRPPGQG